MTTLRCDGLTVSYGSHHAATGVDLVVDGGSCVAIIGPNGAGKSSVLRAIVGITPATGSITLDGDAIPSEPKQRARLVAYVPQKPVMPADMRGHDYVLLGRTPYLSAFGAPSATDHDIAREVLRRLDLASFADRFIGEMSGGEQQRLVVARAAAQRAPVLLLDEPTSALDIGHRQTAMDLVAELQRTDGLAVLVALHDLTLAGLYADELVLMDRGAVARRGTPAEVLRDDVLAAHYPGARLRILHDPDGTVVVVPRR